MRVLVVDDEAMARKRLVRLLAAMPEIEVVGELDDGQPLAARVAQGDVDVVLLDIAMTELSGIEAMGLLPAPSPLIIFVTAHAEHAVAAFEAGALDYVLKPVEPARLKKALDRAKERALARAERTEPKLLRVAIPTRRGLELLDPRELRYALVDGESVLLHTTRGVFVTDFRMSALERKLPAERFVRAHRRVLLNLEHVVALEPVGAGTYLAETSDGAQVPVSRQAARALKSQWEIE